MRIISTFHDYYDVVMRQGMDQQTLYIREQKEIEIVVSALEAYPKTILHTWVKSKNGMTIIECCYLGYCGKIIPFIKITYGYGLDETVLTFFSIEEFKSYAMENFPSIEWDNKKMGNSWWWNRESSMPYVMFFQEQTKKLEEIFHKYNVPIFIFHQKNPRETRDYRLIQLHPSLKEINFQQQKDPYTVFQDIYQYLGGVLNQPEIKMVKVSEDDKIHKHGFDKWSFRKEPSKKK